MVLPRIIQGSPEVAMSIWPVARAVAQAGQLGVVSSAPLAVVLARRLQLGDFDGHLRTALEHFPFPGVARRVWEQFYIPGGKPPGDPFDLVRQPTLESGPALVELTVLAHFAEVFLAKEGHQGAVGLHVSDEVPLPLLPSLYGALLAGVDYVLVSGRNPAQLPVALDRLLQGDRAELPVCVEGGRGGLTCGFDPKSLGSTTLWPLHRPRLLVFVSTPEEAAAAILRAQGRIDGFVWESRPPQGRLPSRGAVDRMRSLGFPFWLGGLPATPEMAGAAITVGAAGVRVTTPFAFCRESPLDQAFKETVLAACRRSAGELSPDWISSPLGTRLSVLRLEGTAAEPRALAARGRLCDVGHFRQPFEREDGTIGYRCPGEPLDHYVQKGGARSRGEEQICFCNALLAGVGLGQVNSAHEAEKAVVSAGEDVRELAQFLPDGQEWYSAKDVIRRLLEAGRGFSGLRASS